MNKKIMIMLLSLLISFVIFVSIIFLQKKLINPNGSQEVYLAIKAIQENTEITEENFNTYFTKKEISKDNLVEESISDKKDLTGKYVKDDILVGEQISKKRITSRKSDVKDKRIYALKFADIGEVVGGTLREGDVIDIILTQEKDQQGKVKTSTVLKNIQIYKAFSSDGSVISRENGDKYSATVLNLMLSAVDAYKLDNSIAKGTVKAIKVVDNSTYNDITIEN